MSYIRLVSSLFVALCFMASGVRAQETVTEPVAEPAATPPTPAASATPAVDAPPAAPPERVDKFTTYVVGMRLKIPDLQHPGQVKLRPTVGFRYGRWKIGTSSDVDGWLAFSGFRKEPTVAYELRTSERINTALSLRIHNLSTGDAFDAFETGRHTLRARALLGYQINPHWALGLELTQDILKRGDGTTFGVGLSRSIPIDEHSLLTLSSGVTWGSAVHGRTPNADHPLAQTLHAGFGSLGVGLGYRYAISPSWAWYVNVGTGRAIGQLSQISGTRWSTGAQLGLLYFGKF
jgi:hypothetical protein